MSRIIVPRRKLWTPPQRQGGYVVLDAYRSGAGGGESNPDLPWTALQIHFDAAVGSGIVDSSPSPKGPSFLGGGVLTTDGPKFGTKCLDTRTPTFNGAGMFLATEPGIVPGTGEFCYDVWMNLDSYSYEQVILSTISTSSGGNGFYIDFHPTYGLLHYSPLGGGLHYAGVTPTAGTWGHLECSKTGSTGYLYWNGDEITHWTDTNNYTNGQLMLGGITYSPPGAVRASGRFDEFRLLIGKGGHTSNFTPPTAPYLDY